MPGISFVTLGVDDLETVLSFYRHWFELSDDRIRRGGDHAALTLEGGFELVLYPRGKIAEHAGQKAGQRSASEFLMTWEVASLDELGAMVEKGVAAGGTHGAAPMEAEWGTSAFVAAPEGHLWEIVWFRPE